MLLTLSSFSGISLKHEMLFTVPADLFSFAKMALIPLTHGLIQNFSPLLTGYLVVTPFVLVEPPSMLLSASPRPSLWLLAVGLQKLGKFMSGITPVFVQPFSLLRYVILYNDILPQLLASSSHHLHPTSLLFSTLS